MKSYNWVDLKTHQLTLLLNGKRYVETKFKTLVENWGQWRVSTIFTYIYGESTQERPYCMWPLVIPTIVYLLTLSLRDSHIYFGIISSESIAFGPFRCLFRHRYRLLLSVMPITNDLSQCAGFSIFTTQKHKMPGFI